ncbi:dual oxidase [Anopheles arabiensis]|uniref:NAD(P)H oxidase (H2O2-forming) n=7 Tax=gambiae species complex TaxID=44542 RepID=A0A1S4H2M1_ANOGA|nr:dual oxidase [Anopheles arabiensis]XP_040165409.1 dual oxidase [Anopheles arabiensis]XP_040235457.1 dual oxidase [Anopheles coluzzii]XP_040235458.1 dual oxidase [Anopheles coluzzii]XP_040235459.1 dual oxidase [Anopheles coluzzii]XP_040235461.1 dual oxidase [Anopheles coluzzii]XP_040235463.1 dual oxidase [Anopheles coluzzii]XP_319115.5 dual oxidase [Anopheles gambiae]
MRTLDRPAAVGLLWSACLLALHFTIPATVGAAESSLMSHVEKQRYDGWYNNLAHPDWGAVDNHLTRKAPSAYSDGVYVMAGSNRPSPRKLSRLFMRGTDGLPSMENRTALLAFFGQVVTNEIVMASESGCPIEMHRIEIEKCDEMYDRECRGDRYIPFHRAAYDRNTGQSPNAPREQINQMTAWIDGSFIYSTSEAWLNAMRSFQDGALLTDKQGTMPVKNTMRVPLFNNPVPHVMRMLSPERLYLLGDPRTNQNPALLSFAILFLRWHNVVAKRVRRQHRDWSDEEIFQRARRVVIASLQNIVAYEYLPAFLDKEIPPYDGYKADTHPGVSHMFQAAAFRFGHSLIPPGLFRRDGQCNFRRTNMDFPALRLCSTWWNSNDVLDNTPVEEFIMGMASQIAEKEDPLLCSDVRDKLFGPMEFTRRDLGALNIMRGRDNGLPDYNTARAAYRLPKKKSWRDINPAVFERQPELLDLLIKTYDNQLDNVDVYVGGMLESDGRPGELFSAVIIDQFTRIRDADRFWFENEDNGIFTKEEIAEIRKFTLWDIIVNSTDIEADEIQRDVFHWKQGDPCPQPEQLNATLLEPCNYLEGYDYFSGSELAYIYSCVFLGFVPILCAGAGYCVIKLQNSRRRKLKIKQEAMKNTANTKVSVEKMVAREWLHANHKRLVTVKFGPEASIYTVDRKGEKLRTFNLKHVDVVTVEQSQENYTAKKPYILLRVPNDHDLVLELESNSARRKFVKKLEDFLVLHKKTMTFVESNRDLMLAKAETRERRQKRLEHFFREAYALTFGLRPGERRRRSDASLDGEVMTVMRTSLSKSEFAAALGMKQDDMFVRKMFNIVDKDKDGRISFQEFLETVVLFSRGKTDDKLRIIFDMCDNDRNGVIDKGELSEMMRSLVEIARTTSVTDEQVNELIDGMFQDVGLEHKNHLTYEDFKLMMKEYKGDFVAIGLDCKGAKQNFLDTSTNVARMTSFHIEPISDSRRHWMQEKWDCYTTFLEENRQNIFYLFLFYVITIVLFVERFIHYSFMAEHTDLRHIMGVGIAITRGSAASLSFCYSLLLLTMSRNLLTKLKEFPIQQYIPLDSHIQFHKIAACTALFFSLLHTVGHIVNFYHVSTQSIENLKCLTKEVHFTSDYRPDITYWLFQTITGVTGVMLFVTMCIIFAFAHPTIRKKAYKFFWNAHSLYVVLYALCLVHGLARLTGAPRFWLFFIGPGIVYTLDKIVSLRTKYMALDVIETDLLPSDVIKIKFYRPPNLKYLSGQWVRLSCTEIKPEEMHSFTLTSAPHENFLSCHIKAQGPWTWKLRNYFDPCNYNPDDQPKIRIEGPFGGGNQDWYKFEVAVMVGGGIGVTPYASILNDLVFGTSTNRYSGVACKKVYFLWICPSHKHFEWFIDVLRDVEKKDVTNVLEIHIFITQFFHKFDLRTTMLYICENHFQRLSKTSMFTGLKAVNHFGRPDMSSFLKFVQKKHSYVSKIGVFSCGPRPLTKSVMSACDEVNKSRKWPYFIHHFENFG